MSFDMGGTSTDVALFNGEIPLTQQCRLGVLAACRFRRWIFIPSVPVEAP